LQTRILYTDGKGSFTETTWECPPCGNNEITVKSVFTGVCRSDIDMMVGKFGPLPINMSGHEGLGQVIAVGKNITGVKLGDYVATRGEPAYADQYNVRCDEYVLVPEADPKYIIEPVACGINIINQPLDALIRRHGHGKRLVILGSGFLAWIAYNALQLLKLQFEIDVVGNNNKDLWKDKLIPDPVGKYDVVIDLSSRSDVFDKDILNADALIVFGAQKEITTDFSNLLWKAVTMIFPSPRNPNFIMCMSQGVKWIQDGDIAIDNFWTKSYNRNTEWKQAFEDGINRPAKYNRGYIEWDQNA